MEQTSLWGYTAQEEITPNDGGNWQFGLNTGVYLKKAELHEKTDKSSMKVMFAFGHKEDDDEKYYKKLYIFEPNTEKQWDKGVEVLSSDPKFQDLYAKDVKKACRTMLDLAECYYDAVKIQDAISKNSPKSFKDYANIIVSIINKADFKNIELDLFLQYSSRLYEGKSFLEIPNANMGHYVVKHQEGDYREERVEKHHLKYFLYENDVKTDKIHPFCRGNFAPWWEKNASKVEVPEETTTTTNSTDISWVTDNSSSNENSGMDLSDLL